MRAFSRIYDLRPGLNVGFYILHNFTRGMNTSLTLNNFFRQKNAMLKWNHSNLFIRVGACKMRRLNWAWITSYSRIMKTYLEGILQLSDRFLKL